MGVQVPLRAREQRSPLLRKGASCIPGSGTRCAVGGRRPEPDRGGGLGRDGGGVSEGDRVVLFGPASAAPGDRVPTATDWADTVGTIDYEIVSRVGSRAVRRYVNEAGEPVDV